MGRDESGVSREGQHHRTLGDCRRPLVEAVPHLSERIPAGRHFEFSDLTGRGVLGNVAASGTAIIDSFGAEHMRTGDWIVYTSADSVFQVASHEDVVPLEELYRACESARRMLVAPHDVSRVIARPFMGAEGSFRRTGNRRDFSIDPPAETLLDALATAGGGEIRRWKGG